MTLSLAIDNTEVSIWPILTGNIAELRYFSIFTLDMQIRRNTIALYHGADGARGLVFTGWDGRGEETFLKGRLVRDGAGRWMKK